MLPPSGHLFWDSSSNENAQVLREVSHGKQFFFLEGQMGKYDLIDSKGNLLTTRTSFYIKI